MSQLQDGVTRRVNVKREAVVSGGAVNSPQLLLLSGIGPADDLEEIGIPVVHNLPGVGKNLHNHVSYGMDFAVPQARLRQYNDDDVERYLANQTGPLSSTGLAQMTGVIASKYTTPLDPDIQIFMSGFQEACTFNGAIDAPGVGTDEPVRFIAVNLHPKSRGIVECLFATKIINRFIYLSHTDKMSTVESTKNADGYVQINVSLIRLKNRVVEEFLSIIREKYSVPSKYFFRSIKN